MHLTVADGWHRGNNGGDDCGCFIGVKVSNVPLVLDSEVCAKQRNETIESVEAVDMGGPCIHFQLFDSHCHLQGPRIFKVAPILIGNSLDTGVIHFAINGDSEKDWHLVKEMSDTYPSVVPNFGLHPWYVSDRTDNWLNTLKKFFEVIPSAAIGEIGLDKGS
ncbi:unnamed protein product [Fraxinus pennsylvanica]|uniref:Uncharacterized protein n=1 Tax=Fraxinus pennsylvanica TaxID=56036 RepID=A0AAD2DLT0_9LAMI|nr:unnamed protein product [Fraxinus pennsylvanica]